MTNIAFPCQPCSVSPCVYVGDGSNPSPSASKSALRNSLPAGALGLREKSSFGANSYKRRFSPLPLFLLAGRLWARLTMYSSHEVETGPKSRGEWRVNLPSLSRDVKTAIWEEATERRQVDAIPPVRWAANRNCSMNIFDEYGSPPSRQQDEIQELTV